MTHKPITKVGIITKRNLLEVPKNLALLKQLTKYLKAQKVEIFYDNNCHKIFPKEKGYKKEEILRTVDMAITLGGDGTILKTARSISKHKVLLFPVNLGNLGFLTETNPDKLFETLSISFSKINMQLINVHFFVLLFIEKIKKSALISHSMMR
jgi:NAD+ kinase